MPDPTYVTIPDLTAATDGSINDNLLLEAAIPDGGGYVSRKVTKGQLVADLKSEISELGGLSDDVKTALLQIAQKVAYVDDDGQTYYQDLYDALYPPAELVSIGAVYTQSGTVYDTDTLDSLKADLVVTALYDDSTTETVTAYTLSGTLTEGTSTITVAYGGKTTTFNVTVTSAPLIPSEYQQVEYIGFDGSSRIVASSTNLDTHNMKMDVVAMVHQGSSEEVIAGLCSGSSVDAELGTDGTANSIFLYHHGYARATGLSNLYTSKAHIVAYSNTNASVMTLIVTVGEQEVTKTLSDVRTETGRRFVLGSGGYSSQRYGYKGRIYSADCYNGETKVHELIPCYRKSDNVIGMYDVLTSTFLTNSGSGTLTKGGDV